MAVRLTRRAPGLYTAMVRAKESGCSPFELEVNGPDPLYDDRDLCYRWCVRSDDERFFPTLRDARAYINRFFEPVKLAA